MSLKELTDEEILQHLKNDTLRRNQQLSVLLKLLNTRKESTTIAIDGGWGTGKTVFVKQMMLLTNTEHSIQNASLDEAAIEEFRGAQRVFYFNAWENDYHSDALSALLLKLIIDNEEGLNEAIVRRGFSMLNPSALIKKLSLEFIDINGKPKKDRIIEDIKSLMNRRDAVHGLIENLLKGRYKRVVFVIDELDRCRPSFAVDLLEVIKHYFERNDVTFVITTNTKELTHTIKKYYGVDFDGYGYLNKLIDFTIGLQRIDIKQYTQNVLKWSNDLRVVYKVAHDAIDYFGLEMREINSYYSALKLINSFLERDSVWDEEQYPVQLIFVPLALTLKIKNHDDYRNFISGNGAKLLRDFLPHSAGARQLGRSYITDRTGASKEELSQMAVDALIANYTKMFQLSEYGEGSENLADFHEAILLISSFTTLDE